MVRISKIYTRTGDGGQTALVDGSRVSKDSQRVEAYGEIDELNSILGILTASDPKADFVSNLRLIQSELFDLGSQLAAPAGFDAFPIFKVNETHIIRFEKWIDDITEGLEPLTSFVLPGGTRLNAEIHLARTVCRRAERRIVTLSNQEFVEPLTIAYFNRLSDYLFALARYESKRSEVEEVLWVPSTKR